MDLTQKYQWVALYGHLSGIEEAQGGFSGTIDLGRCNEECWIFALTLASYNVFNLDYLFS